MDINNVLTIAVSVIVAGVLITVGYGLIQLIDRTKTSNPLQADVLHALREFAKEAYAAGLSMVLVQEQTISQDLQTANIKAIADRYYTLLPDTIMIAGKPIPLSIIKVLVSQDNWEILVADVAHEIEARISRNQTWLQSQLTLTPVSQTLSMPPGLLQALANAAGQQVITVQQPPPTPDAVQSPPVDGNLPTNPS